MTAQGLGLVAEVVVFRAAVDGGAVRLAAGAARRGARAGLRVGPAGVAVGTQRLTKSR